jgi:two-component system OmpR family response regulator
MLVDDDPDIRFVAEIALARVGGWEVVVASSGRAALETLTVADAVLPDVVLLDVTMLEMDGPSTIAALKDDARLSGIPVIFMTARVQAADVAGYLALGAIGVIHKPFNTMSLPDLIREIVGG